jgi:arginyl-tRNA synthetase
LEAWVRAALAEKFPDLADPSLEIIDTKSPDHGDYACNVAMINAKKVGLAPRDFASALIPVLLAKSEGWIKEIDVAGPGFMNFRLEPSKVGTLVGDVLDQAATFGNAAKKTGRSVNVEFVSVNPNGPITIGSGRGAAYGDTLCRVLEASGDTVAREYYINDGVNSEQMRLFAESVWALAEGRELPENGYKGEYVSDVADQVKAKGIPAGADTAWFQAAAQDLMIERQKGDLALFGVEFNRWFSEQSLHDSGKVAKALEVLKANGTADDQPLSNEIVREGKESKLVQKEEAPGPLWLRSTQFGDDKDRVLTRSDGRPAYIAADVAYMQDKLGDRGYDKAYLLLGPDHHGYVPRMNAVCQALGFASERFQIVIFQLVRFLKDGKPAPMRKRDGNIYELRDLIREVGETVAPKESPAEQMRIGRDVGRFFYLMRSHDTSMDFDIDLATQEGDENPVFYVQYAHARICSIVRKAEEAGFQADAAESARLVAFEETQLIKKIIDLPYEVQRCAVDFGLHRLTTYAIELARTYHHFYGACRVIQPEQPELSRARLALCQATAVALRKALDLLGVSAPEVMVSLSER